MVQCERQACESPPQCDQNPSKDMQKKKKKDMQRDPTELMTLYQHLRGWQEPLGKGQSRREWGGGLPGKGQKLSCYSVGPSYHMAH